jgi:hypothetical protein
MIEILDQSKARDSECIMKNLVLTLSVFQVQCHYQQIIRKWNSVTNSVGKSSKNPMAPNMSCYYCYKNNHNTADCRAIIKFKKQKKVCGERFLDLLFLLKEFNSFKRQLNPEKTASSKKRKAELILSTEIN